MSEPIKWTTETRKLSELIPWEDNPRFIKTEQGERLKLSLRDFGYSQLIEIEPDNKIIDGHQRDFLMQTMSEFTPDTIIEVRVSSRKFTKKERQRYIVYKHKGATGEFDPELLANDFEFAELVEWGFDPKELLGKPEPQDAEPQIDRAAELNEKWQVKTGDLWRIGEHRLLCGDSTKREDVERVMDEPADMVFTDPPYAIFGSSTGVKTEVSDDNLIRPFFRMLAKTIHDSLKVRGHAYICCDWRTFPTIRDEIGALIQIKNNIVWNKGSAGYSGSFYSNTYENIAFFVNEAQSHSMFKSYNEKGTPDHKQVYDANVWDIKRVPINDREHFAEKPVEVVERAIKNSTENRAIVFDPFAGSGTTLVACENLHRKCRAIEISPNYCAVILQRMTDAFPGIEIERLDS